MSSQSNHTDLKFMILRRIKIASVTWGLTRSRKGLTRSRRKEEHWKNDVNAARRRKSFKKKAGKNQGNYRMNNFEKLRREAQVGQCLQKNVAWAGIVNLRVKILSPPNIPIFKMEILVMDPYMVLICTEVKKKSGLLFINNLKWDKIRKGTICLKIASKF